MPADLKHSEQELPSGPQTAAPVRIVMLSPHPTVRGPLPKHTPLLVEALRDLGCEVLSVPWGRHCDADSLARRLWSRARDTGELRTLLRRTKFDVLVVKTSHEWVSLIRDLPLSLVTRRSAPCTVLQFHGGQAEKLAAPGSRLFKAATWALFRLTDGVLLLSSDEARAAAMFYPRGSFHVVINPFLPALHSGGPSAERKLDAPATILFVGRLIEEKGAFDVLQAVSVLRERRPVKLVIAGGGPAAPALARRVEALGITEEVTLAGHVDGERLHELYAASDVFVLPTYWAEGFPTVISEAMNAGLPIVTTRMRGMADHLTEGENAVFVPPKAPSELAAAIERLLRDPALRARMGDANRDKVKQFAPQVAAARYLQALIEIALGNKGVPT